MSTVTALLTNKAYGYPTRGARRPRKPTTLAWMQPALVGVQPSTAKRHLAGRGRASRPSS
jgi:hypothetical protein